MEVSLLDGRFLLLSLALLAIGYVIQMRYLHRLARYPGPFLASLSPYYTVQMSKSADYPQAMAKLHKRYGPVVRIAPNEVVIDLPEAIPLICAFGQAYLKTNG